MYNTNIRPENPVFDVQQVNKSLVTVNAWIDGNIMNQRGAAMVDRDTHLTHSGRPGEEYFTEYVAGILLRTSSVTGADDETIFDALDDVLDELESTWMLDPVPDESDPDIAFSMWIGQAQSASLEALLLKAIQQPVFESVDDSSWDGLGEFSGREDWMKSAKTVKPVAFSSKRALEIMKQARTMAKSGPWSDQLMKVMKKSENQYVLDVWSKIPGKSSFVDALNFIADGQ